MLDIKGHTGTYISLINKQFSIRYPCFYWFIGPTCFTDLKVSLFYPNFL